MRYLLRKITDAVIHIRAAPRVIVVVWRHTRGSWFIYQDQPDWFVELIANDDSNINSKVVNELLVLAQEEVKRRALRTERAAQATEQV